MEQLYRFQELPTDSSYLDSRVVRCAELSTLIGHETHVSETAVLNYVAVKRGDMIEVQGLNVKHNVKALTHATTESITNQRKPFNLSVGVKVLVEDKQGNNTLPGKLWGCKANEAVG